MDSLKLPYWSECSMHFRSSSPTMLVLRLPDRMGGKVVCGPCTASVLTKFLSVGTEHEV